MELNKNGMMDRLAARITAGTISPREGWRQMRSLYRAMTSCEQTTDYCRVIIALEKIAPPDYVAAWIK